MIVINDKKKMCCKLKKKIVKFEPGIYQTKFSVKQNFNMGNMHYFKFPLINYTYACGLTINQRETLS